MILEFGRYQGSPIADVSSKYLNWCLEHHAIDQATARKFYRELNRRKEAKQVREQQEAAASEQYTDRLIQELRAKLDDGERQSAP